MWEKQIEHKKYYRFSPVDLKTSNLKPGLIDLDLVRGKIIVYWWWIRFITFIYDTFDLGSSFTKAKPKHGLLTVIKLATFRIFLLPFYIKWWVLQTSTKVAFGLLLVYIAQICNIYSFYTYIDKRQDNAEIQMTSADILVPLFMMWTLSMIHSQIVSTSPGSEKSQLKRSQKNIKKKFARTK